MPRHPFQQTGQQVGLAVGVVDPVDHGVLIGDPPPGGFKVPAAGVYQLLHSHRAVHRHNFGPGLVIGSMQGDRQR